MNIKEWWDTRNQAQQKKIRAWGLGVILVLIIIFAYVTRKTDTDILSGKVEERTLLQKTNQQQTLEELANDLYALKSKFEDTIEEIKKNNSGISKEEIDETIRNALKEEKSIPKLDIDTNANLVPPLDMNENNINFNNNFNQDFNQQKKQEAKGTESYNFKDLAPSQHLTPEQKSENEIKDNGIYFPAGTIINLVSFSGLNAPVKALNSLGGTDTDMPINFRVKGDVILPNNYKANLTDCIVTGAARGQMADERVMVRASYLSCILEENGKFVSSVETKLEGVVFGEDGKSGFRGNLTSKTGEVVAQMLRVGLIKGAGDVVQAGATAYASNINKGTVGITVNTRSREFEQKAIQNLGGTSNDIFNKIADIYQSYADLVVPVIELNAGREGSLIVQKGFHLQTKQQ